MRSAATADRSCDARTGLPAFSSVLAWERSVSIASG